MKKTPSKKGAERRKKPRGSQARRDTVATRSSAASVMKESCTHCSKNLSGNDRALFVEEEIARVFCSEKCIAAYFTPEIERLEKEYFRHLSNHDLSAQEREELAHLRWITLQEPDELWREKTLSGDYRYTLISQFQPGNKRVWCICICLFLRGEPSFLYLAFPTNDPAMVNYYRRGEKIPWVKPAESSTAPVIETAAEKDPANTMIDRLADSWTEAETFRAQITKERRSDDIPSEEFGLYQSCLEETLETPDEVWSVQMEEENPARFYHFLRYYPDEKPGVWYVVVARETEDEEQIEILDAFPTRDVSLVDRYRRGQQEVGQSEAAPTSRIVH